MRRAGVTASTLAHDGFYDAVLRCTEQALSIRRHTAVLCETAADAESPELGARALRASLARRGVAAVVEPARLAGLFDVRCDIVRPGLVSIIIPSIGARDLVKICLSSIRRYEPGMEYEIICIDNIQGNHASWRSWFKHNADVVVEAPVQFNWSVLNNLGVAQARGEYLLFLNDDVEIREAGWLARLVSIAQTAGGWRRRSPAALSRRPGSARGYVSGCARRSAPRISFSRTPGARLFRGWPSASATSRQ